MQTLKEALPALLARQDEPYLELTLEEYIELSDKHTPILRWKFEQPEGQNPKGVWKK